MSKALLFAGLLVLAACSETLPEVGSALGKASDVAGELGKAYETAKETRLTLEGLYDQMCPAAGAEPCAKMRVGLDKAAELESKSYEGLSVAIDALNLAIEAYNEVNGGG